MIKTVMWKLNTSNKGKLAEYNTFFLSHGIHLESTSIDLPEILSVDPYEVMRQKVSSLPDMTLIDDTSLDIEGMETGTNIKWLENDILEKNILYRGRRSTFRVLLAYRIGEECFIHEGKVEGKICEPKGKGFGFDPMFMPLDKYANPVGKSLGEDKPHEVNARFLAVESLIRGLSIVMPVMRGYSGPWQGVI